MTGSGRTGVLLVTPEAVGPRMAGPAIRCLELARALARDGRCGPVTVAALGGADRVDDLVDLPAVTDATALRALVAGVSAVVVQGDVLGLHPWLAEEPVPIVVDAYDPFHLEQLEQARPLGEVARRVVVRDCVRSLNTQLARADLVLCASDRQRALWLGHLAALGRVNPLTYDAAPDLSGLVVVVPFGTPVVRVPERDRSVLDVLPGIGPDDVVLLWGGGVYEWFDPELLVRAVAGAGEPEVRLVFLGTRHPVPGVRSAVAAARAAAEETGTLGVSVHFLEGWVPYDERGRWLAAADVGVSTHHAHVETEFAFRTRLLDYLWAGLPVLSTGGDDLAELVAARGAGLTVPAADLDALAAAVRRVARDAAWRSAAGREASALGASMHWDRVVRPLADWCAVPVRAPDLALSRTDRALLGLGDPRRSSLVDRARSTWREGGLGLMRRRLTGRLRHR